MSTQAAYRIQVALMNPAGVLRDLGAGKTKEGGAKAAEVTKSRFAGGEDEYVWPMPATNDDITVTFEAWALRPNYAFADACVGRGTATLTLVRLNADFEPVENVWVKTALLSSLGDIDTDANGDDMADVELEFVIGKPGPA